MCVGTFRSLFFPTMKALEFKLMSSALAANTLTPWTISPATRETVLRLIFFYFSIAFIALANLELTLQTRLIVNLYQSSASVLKVLAYHHTKLSNSFVCWFVVTEVEPEASFARQAFYHWAICPQAQESIYEAICMEAQTCSTERLRQNNHQKFENSLGYIVSSRPASATKQNPARMTREEVAN